MLIHFGSIYWAVEDLFQDAESFDAVDEVLYNSWASAFLERNLPDTMNVLKDVGELLTYKTFAKVAMRNAIHDKIRADYEMGVICG